MSAYLTWPEARDLALAGAPVRRDSWPTGIMMGGTYSGLLFPTWLERRIGLWVGTDDRHAFVRVVDPGIFGLLEFYAKDWTTDPPGTTRDVCQIDPPEPVFVPPGVGLDGEPGVATIDLHADIGASSPGGVFTILYYLDGALVGTREAAAPGRYTLTVPFSWSSYSTAGRVRAWIDVRSTLPLPMWAGYAEWSIEFPAASYFTINLGTEFVDYPPGIWGPIGWFGPDKTYGPYPDNRWIYAHASDGSMTPSADDDLAINAVKIHPDNLASYVVPGGATEMLLFLPAGRTFTLNIWNAGGNMWGHGYLRLYNRPV